MWQIAIFFGLYVRLVLDFPYSSRLYRSRPNPPRLNPLQNPATMAAVYLLAPGIKKEASIH
jgi:hypothetical protein